MENLPIWVGMMAGSAIEKIATITVPTNHIIQKMYSRLDQRLHRLAADDRSAPGGHVERDAG